MKFIVKNLLFVIFLLSLISGNSCQTSPSQTSSNQTPQTQISTIIAKSFAFPTGEKEFITEAKDKKDDWYNAQDFTANNHLGEDWNKNSGGNTDCGEPVYAAADGEITYAEDAGAGWGNVVIIEHNLPNGKKVQTLYGHLEKIVKSAGEVKKREQIGTIGSANGAYFCHLHFELREESCPMWNKPGNGYDAENKGWLDPSDFIEARK